MRKKGEFPKVVKTGGVTVKVYRVRHRTTASGWVYTVAWTSPEGRRTSQFADEAAALEEARLKAAQIAGGRIEGAAMGRGDRDELQAARALAGDVPILAALKEWAQARTITSGQIIQAAEAWVARQGTNLADITVADAVNRFMAAKIKAGVDVKNSYQKILPTFVTAMGERSLQTISSRELSTWMEERYHHPVSRNTARKRIVALWRWARRQGYLPRDVMTEAEQTETAREATAVIGVIPSPVFAALLARFRARHPEYLAPLVIAGFCGLRRGEVHQQTWEEVNLERRFVRVSAAKRNTPARRLVPLCAEAIAWLELCPDRTGPVCSNLAIDRIREIAREADFDLPENCFRHSFISHRVAQTGNVPQVALEAGNSPQIIFRHYRELFTKEEGEAWFAIKPGR